MLTNARATKPSRSTQTFISLITALFIGFFSLALSPAVQAKSKTHNMVKTEKSKVVILTASWCGYCNKLRHYLNSNDIKFTEYDIEKSNMGYQLYRSLGGKGIPVVKIGVNVIYGYNPDMLKEVLSENGYNLP